MSYKRSAADLTTQLKKPNSLRACIDQNCRDCCYDSLDKGTWRQQVEACEIASCALWNVRPKSKAGKRQNQIEGPTLIAGHMLDERTPCSAVTVHSDKGITS